MRLRLGWGWGCMGLLLGLLGGVNDARACATCTDQMICTSSARGASMCLGDGYWCAMAGKCSGGVRFEGDYAMVQVTLLDAAGFVPAPRGRVVREAGAVSVGREAARVLRRAGATAPGDGAVAFSADGVIEAGTAAFRSERGDGFTIRREGEGRGARVVVSDFSAERSGRVLADERLGEHDALIVRVTLDGRPRVLVLQAATLPAAEARERHERCRRELAESASLRAQPLRPWFELRALDE